MKRLGFLIILIFLSELTFGQDFDHLMTKRQIDCADISYNSGEHFVRFMHENKLDSAKYLLQYWETKCGMREPIFRAKILLALRENKFSDTLLIDGTLDYIFNYKNRKEMINYGNFYPYDAYKSYYGFTPPGQEFDKYSQVLAMSLMENYSPESIEHLLAEFYGVTTDTIFPKLQSKAYKETTLSIEYERAVNRYVNMGQFHISWITGVWIPAGELKKLGVHPDLGFQIGIKHRKMNYDLIMTFKFLNSINDYYARRTKSDNSLELTDHFFGGHIGFDIGRDIYAKNGHELQITGGIAIDGFDALKEDKNNDLDSETTWTYNFSFGLGYRYYVTDSFYLGLSGKYNVVDYSLNDVIDFTGNPITIQFIIGGLSNIIRSNNLKSLQYNPKK